MWSDILKAKLSLTETRLLKELMDDGEWRTATQMVRELGWNINRRTAVVGKMKKLAFSYESRKKKVQRPKYNTWDMITEWRVIRRG